MGPKRKSARDRDTEVISFPLGQICPAPTVPTAATTLPHIVVRSFKCLQPASIPSPSLPLHVDRDTVIRSFPLPAAAGPAHGPVSSSSTQPASSGVCVSKKSFVDPDSITQSFSLAGKRSLQSMLGDEDYAHETRSRGELRRNLDYGVTIVTAEIRSDGRRRAITRSLPAASTRAGPCQRLANDMSTYDFGRWQEHCRLGLPRDEFVLSTPQSVIEPQGTSPPDRSSVVAQYTATVDDFVQDNNDWDDGPTIVTRTWSELGSADELRDGARGLGVSGSRAVVPTNLEAKRKRVRSAAGDDPMADWRLRLDKIKRRIFGLESDSQFTGNLLKCERCSTPVDPSAPDSSFYRCIDCLDGRLQCKACMQKQHRYDPFHRMQIVVADMGGHCFEPVAPAALGIEIHLGHRGARCPSPDARNMTVMDICGVYNMVVNFCSCTAGLDDMNQLFDSRLFPATCLKPRTAFTFRCLDIYDVLSLESKLTAYEFCAATARFTDNVVPSEVDSRYPQFLNVSRLWAYWEDIKHAGESYADWNGDLALMCPACPHEGINLPPDWRFAPTDLRYLYYDFAAFDANMKLRRNRKAGERIDPALRQGRAYCVDDEPYLDWLHEAGGSDLFDDEPTCSGFRQQTLANVKGKVGVAVTGVGGGMCSRHEFIRPHSIVDLQKGERYCNMDYAIGSGLQRIRPTHIEDPRVLVDGVEGAEGLCATIDGLVRQQANAPLPGQACDLMPDAFTLNPPAPHVSTPPPSPQSTGSSSLNVITSFLRKCKTPLYPAPTSLVAAHVQTIVLSYDVVCQWAVNSRKRMATWPIDLKLDTVRMVHVIPKAHLPMHKVACHGKYSFNYIFGVGRTDGEGIERGWGESNMSAKSTIEMKAGYRHDTLDHRWTYHNFKKKTGLGALLSRRLLLAIQATRLIEAELAMFEDKLPPAHIAQWKEDIRAWEDEELTDSPFVSRKAPCLTQAERALENEKRDQREREGGEWLTLTDGPIGHRLSVVQFVVGALAIEVMQRQVEKLADPSSLTTVQETALIAARKSLQNKITEWRQHQAEHMPNAFAVVQQSLDSLRLHADKADDDVYPETVPLMLPSAFDAPSRTEHGLDRLARIEVDLRLGAATDALHKLRAAFRFKSTILRFQREGFRSQSTNTRARVRLASAESRITVQVLAYRHHQVALVALGVDKTVARELKNSDLKALSEWVFGDPLKTGQKNRHIPWIWLRDGIAEEVDDDEAVLDDMRVEYMKTLASAHRWPEEEHLLREEMRRTLLTLEYEEVVWINRMLRHKDGLRSYALRQARVRRRLRNHFAEQWAIFDQPAAVEEAIKKSQERRARLAGSDGAECAPLLDLADDE